MFRREKDTRRTVNSVRDHQKTMEAFGRASGGNLENHPIWKFDHSEIQNVDIPGSETINISTPSVGGKGRHPDTRPFMPYSTLPGAGHVSTYHPDIAESGRYRGMNLIKQGNMGIKEKKGKN
jgi:hypothetical protein